MAGGSKVSQLGALYSDEIRTPTLDHEGELKKNKSKPKPRPLPPVPISYLQKMPCNEAIYTKEVPQHWLTQNIPQPPIDTGCPRLTPLPFGWFGEPIFARPAPSSRPLPQPPVAFTPLTKKEAYDDFLDESYEQWVGEMEKHRSLVQWLSGCEVAHNTHSWMVGEAY